MEHQYMNREISYTRDYASHLAGKNHLIDDAISVGKGVVSAVGSVISLFKKSPTPAATADLQNQLLKQRNTLLQNACTYSDISAYNSLIWNDFQTLDQAALKASGHNVYEYFIYFTPDASKFDKNDTYGVIANRSVAPSANGRQLTDTCPQSEKFFFNSLAERNAMNFTAATAITSATQASGSLSLGQTGVSNVTNKTSLAGLSTPLIILMVLVIGGFFFINKK